jgi:hypothetical protein
MDLVHLLIYLIIICLIFGVAWWAITQIPLPPPVRTVIVVIFALILILVLLSLIGVIPMRVASAHPLVL